MKRQCFFQIKYCYFGKFVSSEVEPHHCYSAAGVTAVWGAQGEDPEGAQRSEDMDCFSVSSAIPRASTGTGT